jgi:GNAT superfamily N-acetyltransferase
VNAEALYTPEPLGPQHELTDFDCGEPALNAYLTERALGDSRDDKSVTHVVCRGERVIAYYSLAAGSVEPQNATERPAKGQGRQTIPVIVLARLAVDLTEQGHGLGEQMLLQALARAAEAASLIGARAVLVHAKDVRARAFYQRYGFEQSPTHPLHLILLMKDVRRSLGA